MLLDDLVIRSPKDWEYASKMEPDQSTPDFGDAYRVVLRPPTLLVQQVIALNKEFEAATSRAIGLNSTDMAALGEVMMAGPQSPTDLARRLQVSTAAVTTIVDRLEAAGHVTRSQHPTDRRGVLVSPTPESVDRAMRTLLPVAQAIDSALDQFDEDQRAVITTYLETVAEHQRAALEA
jgi:DNA-binding MarR family transcriptional regulator